MSGIRPAMNQPNLVCPYPACGYQLKHREFWNAIRESFSEFVANFHCPRCTEQIHPEDAVLEYHRQIGYEESSAHPFSIGGYCNLGSVELTPGHSKRESVLQGISIDVVHDGTVTSESTYGMPTDIEAAQLFDANAVESDPPFSIHDLDGQAVHPQQGPRLTAGDAVIIDVYESDLDSNRAEVVFTSSILEATECESVATGYYTKYKPADLEGPPWTSYFAEGIQAAYNENHRVAIPLFFSGFDNLIERLLHRAFSQQGCSDECIGIFLDANPEWYNMLKGNMDAALDDRLTNLAPDVFRRFDELRTYRNEGLIHLRSNLEPTETFDGDAFDAFELIMEAVIPIFDQYRDTVLTS